jgi:hypothetical protein
MNIFYLHHLPEIAAGYHCDKHVGKMLVESCQLLATAHHVYGNGQHVTYKATHQNHPSAIWVRESRAHYMWVSDLGRALARQFMWRYGHDHKSRSILINELMLPPPAMQDLPLLWRTPTQAMPDEYKHDDAIVAYRRYYASKAANMPLLYNRGKDPQPLWLRDLLSESQLVSA